MFGEWNQRKKRKFQGQLEHNFMICNEVYLLEIYASLFFKLSLSLFALL